MLCWLARALSPAPPPPSRSASTSAPVWRCGGISGEIVRLVLLLTVLSLAPGILVMVTSFTRIVVVLSFLRTAIGLQQSPPNAVLVGLSLFLTAFVMAPTFERAWTDGLAPLIDHEIGEQEAFARAARPFHAFMQAQAREKDLSLFLDIARLPPPAHLLPPKAPTCCRCASLSPPS